VLLLYTDGLVDALGLKDGPAILETALKTGHYRGAQALADSIHKLAIRTVTHHTPDDIALVIVKKTK
jgi:serine phosphatase RsbU (regulator of sigma subunit)